MKRDKDPMGAAIADYERCGHAGRLRVFSPDFEEDEIPVDTLFRSYAEMPPLEQQALRLATGRTLDVGAGAGCHSLALQQRGAEVVAIDISPLSVEAMRRRGVADVREQDFWTLSDDHFDTVLMLMNGIGIVGTLDALPRFFRHVDTILSAGGQIVIDSTDLCYLYEDDEGQTVLPTDGYYGEMQYTMQYKRVKGEPFTWLYLDFDTLRRVAAECGWRAELVAEGEHYDYLARITRA